MEDNYILESFLDKSDVDIASSRKRKSKYDDLFGERKNKLLTKIKHGNLSVKNYYDELCRIGIIKDGSYNSFFMWVKRNLDAVEEIKIVEQNQESIPETIIEELSRNNGLESQNNFYNTNQELFDKYFFGFNMDGEYEIDINQPPLIDELTKENIFNIFSNDYTLNNEKIAKILLYEISVKKRNIFKNIWLFMLIKANESLDEYYERLDNIINESESYSHGITNATGSIHDIGFYCGINHFKIIRSRY